MAPLGGMPLARPLEELSPQATERALAVTVYPLRLRFAQPPLPKGEAMNTGKGIFWCMSASLRGKGPRKPKGFSWSVQGSLRGNRNPLRLVFFLSLFRPLLHTFHTLIHILCFPAISRHNLLWRAVCFRVFLRPACPTIVLSEVLAEERRYAKDEKPVGTGIWPGPVSADCAHPAEPPAAAQAF